MLSSYSVSFLWGLCSHTHFVKGMTMTPGDRETPGLCTHHYTELHGFNTDGVSLRDCLKKKKKKICFFLFVFFNLFLFYFFTFIVGIAAASCNHIYLFNHHTLGMNMAGGLHSATWPFYLSKQQNCTRVSRAVYYISITEGQPQSSSFRTCAVSALTAHRLISLMQSKHVINGPSQPPLFVVRQTLKSNVSTMGGRENLLARQKCWC